MIFPKRRIRGPTSRISALGLLVSASLRKRTLSPPVPALIPLGPPKIALSPPRLSPPLLSQKSFDSIIGIKWVTFRRPATTFGLLSRLL
eukprot:1381911-Pyramimonas_sp.AAC.1